MLEIARTLKDSGLVDVVDVNDNPRARARMSGMMASIAIERHVGIETIPHLTPRDSSIAGLESQLLGAHAEGSGTCSPSPATLRRARTPRARGVYEVDSIGLSRIITRMNAGEDFNGAEIDASTAFFLGVAVNPAADDLDYEHERFQQKLDAGARFAMTRCSSTSRTSTASSSASGVVADPPARRDLLRQELPARTSPPQRSSRDRRARPRPRRGCAMPARTQEPSASSWPRDSSSSHASTPPAHISIPPFRRPLAALEVLG